MTVRLPAVFARHQAEIESEIRSILTERKSPLYDMMRYHFGWIDRYGRSQCVANGKAVRPTLCLLAARAVGGQYQAALPAAAAVELVHNYSLIHDDIQDDDIERRHQPTVWSVWGKPQAINAGTGMRMLANVAVRRLNVPASKQASVQSLLDEATISLIEGQYLDIDFETRFDITVADYIAMVGGKTAALFGCALETGALLGTEDEGKVAAFREFGWDLGMAFQATDDVLGIWGRQEETGKPSCNDIRRKKKTLPVVYALERASGTRREELLRAFSNGSLDEESVLNVLGVLDSVDALEATRQVAKEYSEKAKADISGLDVEPGASRDLHEVVEFLENRSF
jgi:geranylgeranyl diphosphate synthase type I